VTERFASPIFPDTTPERVVRLVFVVVRFVLVVVIELERVV